MSHKGKAFPGGCGSALGEGFASLQRLSPGRPAQPLDFLPLPSQATDKNDFNVKDACIFSTHSADFVVRVTAWQRRR